MLLTTEASRMASRTITRIAAKTNVLVRQVKPKNNPNVVTLRASSSMKAAPMKNIV